MNTTISNNSTDCDLDTRVIAVVFSCLYCVVFLVALSLNSLASWIFYNIPTSSTFVVYLKNMVVADMLMTLTIPVRVLGFAGVGSGHLRVFHCQYSAVLFYFSMYVNILFMGLISLDRYLKIVRPFGKYALQKVRVGRMLSATVWVVMLCLVLANIILPTKPLPGGKLTCEPPRRSKFGMIWYEGSKYFCQVIFWGTFALMVVCYTFISRKMFKSYKASRSSSESPSRRTKAKVFLVVAVFFICFAPFHFVLVPYTLSQTRNAANDCRVENAIYIAKETTLWLSAMNVCLDPLIYIFLCKMFRRLLTDTLSRKAPSNKALLTDTHLQCRDVTVCDRKGC